MKFKGSINTKIVENLKDFEYFPTKYRRYIISELESLIELYCTETPTPDLQKRDSIFKFIFPKKKVSFEQILSVNEEGIRLQGN